MLLSDMLHYAQHDIDRRHYAILLESKRFVPTTRRIVADARMGGGSLVSMGERYSEPLGEHASATC